MSDEPEAQNSLRPAVKERSTQAGDVPEALRQRYYVDGRGGAGLGFYHDAQVKTPAFRDTGKRLEARRSDPHAIRAMTQIAQHRGWSIVVAQGSQSFRREAWLQGRALGLEVRGYRPTERDMQELDRRARKTPERSLFEGSERAARVIGAVVRERVASPEAQHRIVEKAQSRMADLVASGARIVPPPLGRDRILDPRPTRERVRGR